MALRGLRRKGLEFSRLLGLEGEICTSPGGVREQARVLLNHVRNAPDLLALLKQITDDVQQHGP